MQLYRFLLTGAYDPFTGCSWSAEAWLTPPGGVIVYSDGHLAHWIAPELWRVEVAGLVTEREVSLVAAGGRLVERVAGWDASAPAAFLAWCLRRHPAISCTPGDVRWNAACDAGYDASQTAGMDAEAAGRSFEEAEAVERAAQRDWIIRRVAG